jgi:hypothetical protein
MPVYEYQGQHYDISETDPSKAKEKILSHLGKSEPKTEVTVEGAPADIPKADYKPATGLTTPQVTEGGAAFLAPTSLRKEVPVAKQTFGFDPSRINKVPLSEYGSNIARGAATGGAIGGVIGGFTGPGILATAGGGAVMGAASGLAESVAKDLGYGPGTQTLAGLAAGMPAPVKSTTDFLVKSRLAQKVFGMAETAAYTMMPGVAGKVAKLSKFIPQGEAKLAGRDVESALGTEPKTAGVKVSTDPTSETYKFTQELQAQHGKDATVNKLYEDAKAGYDAALAEKTGKGLKEDLTHIVSEFPAESRASSAKKIRKLFLDEDGNPFDGNAVINNLKSDEFKALSNNEQEKVRNAVNKFIPGGAEKVARNASEKEFVAKAKDALPELFKSKDYRTINTQMGNFGKDEIGQKVFKQELGYYLKGLPVEQGKTLWNNIGASVNKSIIKDPAEFKKVTEMINNARTEKELSRAANLIIKATYGAYQIQKEKE